MVAQALVVQHEVADRIRKLRPLPSARLAASLVAPGRSGSRLHSPDRISGGAQLVGRHMGYRSSLTRGVGGVTGRPTKIASPDDKGLLR